MNDKFFSLPEEKQQAIINAGFKVFSQNTYKRSPTSEIAEAAGISKALLFHYFTNKKELFLFLWQKSAEISQEYLLKSGCYEMDDLFEIMAIGLRAKVQIMKHYPDLGNFVMKAFYEKDDEVRQDIQSIAAKYSDYKTNKSMLKFEPSRFRDGLDLQMMYKEMYWASEGYLWEKSQGEVLDVDLMEKDFMKLIEFWKKIYLKQE